MPSVLCHLCQQCYPQYHVMHLPLTSFIICWFCYDAYIQSCDACMTTLESTKRYILEHFPKLVSNQSLYLFFQFPIPLTTYTRKRSLPFVSSFRKLRYSLTRLIWHHQHKAGKRCIQCNAHLYDVKPPKSHLTSHEGDSHITNERRHVSKCSECNYELCESCTMKCQECNTPLCDTHARQCPICLVYYCHECDLFDTCDCCYDSVCPTCIDTMGRLFLCKRQNPTHSLFFHTHSNVNTLVQQLLLTYISQ